MTVRSPKDVGRACAMAGAGLGTGLGLDGVSFA